MTDIETAEGDQQANSFTDVHLVIFLSFFLHQRDCSLQTAKDHGASICPDPLSHQSSSFSFSPFPYLSVRLSIAITLLSFILSFFFLSLSFS